MARTRDRRHAEDWTVHIDESTGNEYRHNSVTGEATWCGEEVEAEYVHAVGDKTPKVARVLKKGHVVIWGRFLRFAIFVFWCVVWSLER